MYALRTLYAPGSLVAGYQRGDEIHPSVVENWGLVVGEEVAEELPDLTEPATPAVPRPDAGANRASWEAYAIANGMDPDDAAAASQDELEGVEPEQANDVPAAGRPADSARKAEWVTYVNEHPQATDEDREWAGDDTTTKADLQAWQPAGDPVAVAAGEAVKQG